MPHWNEVFESIESYDSMTIEALQYSKIGKGASCPTSSRHGIIRRKKKLTGVYYSHEEDYGSHHYSPERQV